MNLEHRPVALNSLFMTALGRQWIALDEAEIGCVSLARVGEPPLEIRHARRQARRFLVGDDRVGKPPLSDRGITLINQHAYEEGHAYAKELRHHSVKAALMVGARMAKAMGQLKEFEKLLVALATHTRGPEVDARDQIAAAAKSNKSHVTPYFFLQVYLESSHKVSHVQRRDTDGRYVSAAKKDSTVTIIHKCLLGVMTWLKDAPLPGTALDCYLLLHPKAGTSKAKAARYRTSTLMSFYLGTDEAPGIGEILPERLIDRSQNIFSND